MSSPAAISVPLTSDQTLSAPSSPPESPSATKKKSAIPNKPKPKPKSKPKPTHQEPLTEHQKEILQQIKKVGPKSYHLFQYDGFGILLCIGIAILGCLPCIRFATISYDKANGGTSPDTNENFKILIFVAPTCVLFALAAILYRLTNQRYPWTEVTFDFLEGCVVYRTSVGLKFMVASLVNKLCCGCFCFASSNPNDTSSLNHEFGSYGKKRVMFHEIKEIGVGRKFKVSGSGTGVEYEYVVGLKIKLDDGEEEEEEEEIDEEVALDEEIVGEKENEEENDQQEEEESEKSNFKNEIRNPVSDGNTAGHITINAKAENKDYYLYDEATDLSKYDEKTREKIKQVLADARRKQQKREAVSSAKSLSGSNSESLLKKKTFELVPLDVCTSQEGVKATITFWKRWMRRQYDSADRMKPEEPGDVSSKVSSKPVAAAARTTAADLTPSASASTDDQDDQEANPPSPSNPLVQQEHSL